MRVNVIERACVLVSIAALVLAAGRPLEAQPALKIVVVEGEDAVNIIQQRTAVAPVVEVRDRNDLPLANVPVTFTIATGGGASFSGGAQTLTVVTNAAGRAAAAGLTPTANGALQISASAAFQGQTAVATITQTNVMTAAQAAAASGAAGGGGAGGAGAGAGAAGGATASGGLSAAAIGGIAAGAAGAAVVAATAVSGGDEGSSTTMSGGSGGTGSSGGGGGGGGGGTSGPPVVSGVSASPDSGLQSSTSFTFTAQGASDPGGGSLSYAFDFGDSTSASGNPVTHAFANSGSFTVRLTVTNSRGATAAASTSVTVKNMTGTWRGTISDGGPFPLTVSVVLTLSQNGTAVTGSYQDNLQNSGSLSGTLSGTTLDFSLSIPGCVVRSAGAVAVGPMIISGTYPGNSACNLSGGTFSFTKN